jgi:hypothetical protein
MASLMPLGQLDVISESTLIYAFQTIARGWRTQEPDELEKPANMDSAVDIVLRLASRYGIDRSRSI